MPIHHSISLSKDIHREIMSHVHQALPDEAVGLLGGDRDGNITMVRPLRNLAGVGAFFADPRSQFKAEKAIQQEDQFVVAAYHSHPGGGLIPSQSDIYFAGLKPMIHVIVAVDQPVYPDGALSAFLVGSGRVHQIKITICE